MRRRRLTRGLATGLLGLALGGTVPAGAVATQGPIATVPAGTTPTTPPAAAIAAFDIPTRAERTVAELREWEAGLASAPEIAGIGQDLPRLRNSLLQLTAHSLDDAADVSPRELDDVERRWQGARDQLAGWADVVAQRLQALEGGLARLRELDEVWTRTADAAVQDRLPDVVTREIATVRAAVRDAQIRAKDQRDALLTLASQIGNLQGKTLAGLASVETAAARMHGDLFATDSPPLWTALREDFPAEPVGDTLARTWQRSDDQLRDVLRREPGKVSAALLAFVLLVLVMLAIRRRSRAWAADDPARQQVQSIAMRPVGAAIILAMSVQGVVVRTVPVALGELSSLLLVVPLLAVLRDRLRGKLRTLVPTTVVLLLILSVRRVLPVGSPESRLLLAVEHTIAIAWALWAVRPHQVARLALSPLRRRWLLYASRGAVALLALAVVANLAGNVSLALIVTRGVFGSTFLGLLVYETRRVVSGLVVAALHAPGAGALHAVTHHAPVLRQRLLAAVRIATTLLWVAGTFDTVGLLPRVTAALGSVLGARLEIGALSLSAGDVLAFGLTVWLSLLVARIVHVVLEDDVLPRMDLPRGVPSAVSAAANYSVLLVGLLLALSAAGLDLGRVTILAGAFGVGIGFGLQNIVNNFVSGLILLFERPVRIGDVIEFGGVNGTVRRIGIRSSTIETFDGAEVIVPNGTLIADQVTNWTFSASQRRVEIRVGVGCGSDPATVLALLERVAAAQADVLRQPPPQALFLGFGDSSLDFVLRAWTGRYDLAAVVRSQLGVAVHGALREAGIEIPFPQRDLHVRSVDPQARGTLAERS